MKKRKKEHLVTKSVRDWPVEPSHRRPASTKPSSTEMSSSRETDKSRERQKRTGYGHRRDRQQRESKRTSPKETEPETESGLGESDNDVNRLLNYHLSLQKEQQQQHQLEGKQAPNRSDAMMFLARDTTTLHRQQKMAIIPEPPKRLSPEDKRMNEINEMIRNANQEIQLDPDDMEDIEVVPLKAKTVSLGQPLSQQQQQAAPRKQPKKQKPTPLSKWADEANGEKDNVELDRNVHLASRAKMQKNSSQQNVIEIKELQKMKRYKNRKDRELRIVL